MIGKIKRWLSTSGAGILFLLPSFCGMGILYIFPLFYSWMVSFSRTALEFDFVGFTHYKELFQSETFRRAWWNTFRFLILAIPTQLLLGLHMAKGIDYLYRKGKGWVFFFTVLLLPMILPSGSVAIFFRVLFDEKGEINFWAQKFGGEVVLWLDSSWSFFVLLLFYLWKNTAATMIIAVTGLRSIPQEVLHAAQLDGANSRQVFWQMQFPMIRPHLFFACLYGIVTVFRVSRQSHLLFGSYPHPSVYMIQNFLSNNFERFNMQRLSAAAIVTLMAFFVGIAGVSLVRFRKSKKRRNEEDL